MISINLNKSLVLITISLLLNISIVQAQLNKFTKNNSLKLTTAKSNSPVSQQVQQNEQKTEDESEQLIADIIFASREYATFDEAKKNSVTMVKDGDPLWMYIKLPKPMETYVDADPYNKDKDGKVRRFINMGIGSQDSPNGDYKACNVIATDEEVSSNEFRISLSPGTVRKGPSLSCYLEVAGGFEAKLRHLEVRLYAKEDGDKIAIGRGRFTLDLTTGKEKYQAVAEDFRQRITKGAPDHNKVPKKGTYTDPSFKELALKQIKAKDINPIKIYYSVNDWEVLYDNATSRKDHRSLYGAYTYKRDNHCLYGVFEVIQDWNDLQGKWDEARIELRDDFRSM